MRKNHPFHIVELSPWPISTSIALLFITLGGSFAMHGYFWGYLCLVPSIFTLLYILYRWWFDIIKEGKNHHTELVKKGLKIGMMLFILTEIVFFGVFFSSVFKFTISPVDILDEVWGIEPGTWPPKDIKTFNPWKLPYLNTLILLLSGTTLTWSQYSSKFGNYKDHLRGLKYTIILGITFTIFQAIEYFHAPFGFYDGIYASNFYMATGFHGIHVIIGTIFLIICYIRAKKNSNAIQNLGFKFAEWYWHFVDIVWIFLFIFLYIVGR